MKKMASYQPGIGYPDFTFIYKFLVVQLLKWTAGFLI